VFGCPACSEAPRSAISVGLNNALTFDSVTVARAGVYKMTVDYASESLRAVLYSVNGGPWVTLNVGGGSFNLPASTTVPVALQAGTNTIRFGNPTSYSPDLDRITISGDGSAVLPIATAYEAENAILGGAASPSYCKFCSEPRKPATSEAAAQL